MSGPAPRSAMFKERRPQRQRGVLRASLLGLAWVALPCGLLQSALLIASLANSAQGGAMVMAGFALVTAGGLAGLTPLLRMRRTGGAAWRWPTRLAGLLLSTASAWTLTQTAISSGWCAV